MKGATSGEARERRVVTLEEARRLPGLLGRVCAAMLQRHGSYQCEIDGARVLFVLRKD